MSIEIDKKRLEGCLHQKQITPQQAQFLLRIAILAYELFPNIDKTTDNLSVFKKGIELTNKWGVRAFYLEGNSKAFYYQYQWDQFDNNCIEPTKAFELFTDEEISSLLQREQFV
jgi:hypothetical protein